MNTNKKLSFKISEKILNTAKKMADKYSEFPKKQKQIRDKTIALCSFNEQSLKPNGLQGKLGAEFLNPHSRLIKNIADLNIKKGDKDYGTIEILTIDDNEDKCHVPVEVLLEKRRAWIVSSINNNMCIIHGFAKKIDDEVLLVDKLEPIENLPKWLELVNNPHFYLLEVFNNINDYVDQSLGEGWEVINSLKDFIQEQQLELAMIPVTTRTKTAKQIVKVFNLDSEKEKEKILVLVEVNPEISSENDYRVYVKFFPVGLDNKLPKDLQLNLIDENKKIVMSARGEESPNFQFDFDAEADEKFSIQLLLDNVNIIQPLALRSIKKIQGG